MTDESIDSGSKPTAPMADSASDDATNPPRNSDSDPISDATDEWTTTGGTGPSSPLSAAMERIRRDPSLLLPFVVAGILLAIVDWGRRRDPLPTLPPENGDETAITVDFAGYPTGAPETVRSLEALVDLKLPYLAWGLGLETFALLVVAAAGAITIARALDGGSESAGRRSERLSTRRVLAYLGLVGLFDVAARVLGSFGDLDPLLGIPLLVLFFVAMVRLFAAPAFVVTGAGPIAALRRSVRATRGSGWSILALVIPIGLTTWLLTLVPLPYAGIVLSSALVAPVHAVAAAAVRERADVSPRTD